VLTDIDHFKKVNDGYGHPMGDEVLRRVSKVFQSSIQRKTDLVARYGGEEFVLVLADTDAAGARGVIDKIRGDREETFEHDGKTFHVTMSAGVIAFPDDAGIGSNQKAAEVKQALIDRADKRSTLERGRPEPLDAVQENRRSARARHRSTLKAAFLSKETAGDSGHRRGLTSRYTSPLHPGGKAKPGFFRKRGHLQCRTFRRQTVTCKARRRNRTS